MITATDETRRGTAYVLAAYLMWGLFPLYFDALKPAGALEILAHRIVWTMALCALILIIRKDLGWLGAALRNRRLMLGMTAAAVLIAVNWGMYVFAVISGQTTEASLGYFLNPIVTVVLGVFVLGEQLRRPQLIAVVIGAIAFVYLTIATGTIPYIALILACSFGLYALVKKRIGASLTAMRGLVLETAILTPVAAALIIITVINGTSTFGSVSTGHTLLLLSNGIVTAIPLLLFAAAARRVPLVTIGLVQFITPVMQLIVAITFLDEHMSRQRWIGFGIVWVALLVLSIDMLRRRRVRPVPRPPL
ncbi:MAG: EamA family transporter RarD [Actinomycetia bacterium]|nr:EamA family transporter RarD [Actinomycetes bacterium]